MDCPEYRIKWTSSVSEVKFTIRKKEKEIQFSKKTMYEILDFTGSIVKKGFSQTVSCLGLKKGKYILNYDNLNSEIEL
jgi:hypothetical protein